MVLIVFSLYFVTVGRSQRWNRRPQPPPSRQGRTGRRTDQPFICEHSLACLQDFLCFSSSGRSPSHSKLMVLAFWLLEASTGVDWIIWLQLDFLTWTWQWHRISKEPTGRRTCFCGQAKAETKTWSHDTNWWTKLLPKASVFILKSFNIYCM